MNISPNALRLSLTRRSLGRFARVAMPAFELSPFHQLIVDKLELLLSGKIKKLAIITPPRHGKTTLGNVIAPAFALGRNPTETVITVSYGSELSETFGRRVRNILSDPAFHEVFPGCKLSPDSSAAYRFTTTAGGEYNATGRGGPITGKGASLLILDDLVKDSSEANSDTVCRGIIEWLQHVAFTRLTPNGRVLAIATRWSERDPMGWILQQAGWTVLHLPALAEKADDPLGRKIGEALWSSHYPVEALDAIRADVGSRVFQTLYQGNVAASQGTIFKRDWFRHYQQPPESFSRIVQSWDTAFKTGATNDFSVCATVGQTQNGFYLLSLYRGKVEFPELKRQVAQQADLWKPSEIYVEDKASGQSLIQELKLATSCPVIAVKIDRDKETRASATTGYYEAGKVFFPEGAAWLPDLEDELASFPGGLHDDCVDALSQALNRLRDSGGVLGLLDVLKDFFSGKRALPPSAEEILRGKSKPRADSSPAVVTVDQWKIWNEQHHGPVCPHPSCKNPNTFLQRDAEGLMHIVCKQCGRIDGLDLPGAEKPGHTHRWRPIPGGFEKCDDCGQQRVIGSLPLTNGVSRAEHGAVQSLDRKIGSSLGRFGWK
jgi:predicted phage terminase large subunit-like protein